MIISRTPFRISFFGGGTDYPSWYLRHGGCVLSTSINKYCYISCRTLPPFFEHRLRIVYSEIENCQHFNEVKHPAVREILRFLNLDQGLEIHHDGDLPARSGMGSSSSFTVGLLNALYAHKGVMASKRQLAAESIDIEQNMIKESVGSQDQVCVAYGGLNLITFSQDEQIFVHPVTVSNGRLRELESHLMLFYTGIRRTASQVAHGFVEDLINKETILKRMQQMAIDGVDLLQSNSDICDFGRLLHDSWLLKRQISENISNFTLDHLYEKARRAGAVGGKITGAGGGGFLLLFVPPRLQGYVREALCDRIHVPFQFEFSGSRIIFYEPETEDYSELEKDRAERKISGFKELDSIKKKHRIEPFPAKSASEPETEYVL